MDASNVSDLTVESTTDDQVGKIEEARRKITEALDGFSKERSCVILAIVAAECGLYDVAIDLLKKARTWRQSIFDAGGS